MVFFGRSSKNRDKNPQSGAEESSSSVTTGSAISDDANVPTVNLTEQRLQDWRAGSLPGSEAAGGALNGGGGTGGGGRTASQQKQQHSVSSSPHRNYTTSPNTLILLIERGEWAAATQRAMSHEHEVKQLVKLRKITKRAGGGGVAPPPATGGGRSGRSGGSGDPHTEISNVKCKALHHACQKLRSVHTTIYQHRESSTAASGTTDSSDSRNDNTRRLIEEDEYIEACKCILTLMRIHPEACKERESRHGCLPLHLCVFSMCATPPPPLSASTSSGSSRATAKGHRRANSGQQGAGLGKPPVVSSRSVSAPMNLLPPSSLLSNLGIRPSTTPSQQQQHHKIPSSSSEDFSLGNISEMIQEESEHQRALTHHRESQQGTDNNNNKKNPTLEERIFAGMKDMEKMLIGLETKEQMKEDKKKREKESKKMAKGGGGDFQQSTTIGLESNVMHAPLYPLEERSRETDSHLESSSGSGGGGNNENGGKTMADERTGAETSSEKKLPPGVAAAISTALDGNSKNVSVDRGGISQASSTSPPSSSLTYEELQRRYLQINTRRREEYSVRVINALLDAWPKSIKTSSEGGRLPLHMACFGKATYRAMETILKAYPESARQRNHDGFLPIHIAAHWGVSHPDIAPLLLRAYPDGAVGRNRWERTPIEEALGMAGENGREHQLSLVWSLRRHPTYWIHNDISTMLLPQNVRSAPWRLVDAGEAASDNGNGGNAAQRRVIGGGAVDVDEVGSSSEEEEGVEVQMAQPSSSSTPQDPHKDPAYVRALAESTDLSLLITKDKNWAAAALRCRRHPHEAREAMEVKVRGAYTAKITPLHYACENRPSVEVVRTLIDANPSALERRQEPGGQLPLHAACTWGASPEVIQTLLAARSSCAEMKDFLSNLPLHCACYSGAPLVVIESLLRVYPQSVWPRNHQGSSALDIVRRLGHRNRREVLGLLERTQGRLLERAAGMGGEGVEADQGSSLEWV